jgi:DNA-binding response OmpR family regulator
MSSWKELQQMILLADDHHATSEIIEIVLQEAGFQVAVAHDGEQALEFLETHVPKAILLDLNLPKCDGFHIAKHLRRFRRFDSTNLIAFSGLVSNDAFTLADASGFDYFLQKPATPIDLQIFIDAPLHSTLVHASANLKARSEELLRKSKALDERSKSARERAEIIRTLYTFGGWKPKGNDPISARVNSSNVSEANER